MIDQTTDPDGSIVTYTYDGSSNRIAAVAETIDGQSVTSSYQYDALGRLTSYTPALPKEYGSITYTWNTLGQKTSMMVPMGNDTAKKYLYYYDNEGRQIGMDAVTVTAGISSNPTLTAGTNDDDTRFFYDDNRNRVKLVTKAGKAYYFVYDPTAAIPSVVYEAVNKSTGVVTYLNAREPDGLLISREKYVGGAFQYSRTYHFDGLGSTIALTDENGNTTDTYSYGEWGNVTHTSGNTDDNPYQYVGEYGYYTHYQEPTFNLLQLGVRYYDPSTGRFTQEDPIKDGLNWYGYAGGNPIGWIDPWGLFRLPADYWEWTSKERIEWLTKDLNKRWGEMNEDHQRLYPDRTGKDGTDWKGHENWYNEEQKQLKKELNRHGNDPDIKNDPELKSRADKWKDKKPPKRPKWAEDEDEKPEREYRRVPKPVINPEKVREATKNTVIVVGTGYLIYRGLRMIPSLFPPLWWTIPANAACL